MARRDLPDLSHAALPGTLLDVRVTPGATRERIVEGADGALAIHVTAPPSDGKANAAVIKLLAKALGVPKSRIELVRGATSRSKLLRIL